MDRRRPGFRLSWTANDKQDDDPQPGEAASEAASAGVDTMTAEAPGGDTSTVTAEPSDMPAEAAGDATAAPVSPAATPDGESSEFLVSLVGAMRGVAESSRDASLAELRTTVDSAIDQLNTAATEKEADLRRAADLDLQAVGDWEHDEVERIKSEAETRRETRRTRLEQQLAEHRSVSEREVEAYRSRLSDHERDLAAFFAQLAEISDPAAFVAAAKRMPRAPELNSTSTPAPAETPAEPSAPSQTDDLRMAALGGMPAEGEGEAPSNTMTAEVEPTPAAEAAVEEAADASTDNRLAARLAQLDQRIAGEAEQVPAATPAAATNGSETSTAVIVKGLGSFGAITSFKQALERVDGVRGVTLSLGPTGEFVYRASHASDFDMVAAVQSVEGPSATVEDTDGTLVVTLSRQR